MMPNTTESENFSDTYLPDIFGLLNRINEAQIKIGLEWLGAFNERRLYWVWAGGIGLLGCIINLLPKDFFYTEQAINALAIPSLIGGFMSWSLYYFRFCINLSLLLQHTRLVSWLFNVEVSDEVLAERFASEWEESKYALINDFFWGNANFACFFWLNGGGIAGHYGDMLTVVLLLMDASLAIYALWEENEKYHKEMLRLSQYILEHQNDDDIKDILRAKCKEKMDLDYKLYSLLSDVLYTITLCLAFCVVCGFFLPPSIVPVTSALVLNITGTVLCFFLNSLFAAIQRGLDISKSVEIWENLRKEQMDFLSKYNKLKSPLETETDYLQSLITKMDIQQQSIMYKKVSLLRAILIDILIPPIVFFALIFTPLNIGLSLIALGLVLAIASYDYIEKNYKVTDPSPPVMIAENMIGKRLQRLSQTTQGFFSKTADALQKNRGVMIPNVGFLPDDRSCYVY